MYRLLIITIVASVLFASCQKEASSNPPQGGTDTTVTTPPTNKDTSYQPVTKDSYWAYKSIAAGQDTGSIDTLRATGTKKDYNGHSYNVFKGSLAGSDSSGESLMRSDADGNMYMLADLSQLGTSAGALEILYTNTKSAVNATWTYNGGSISGFPVSMAGKILEKNISKDVQGKTYTNVIHSQVNAGFTLGLQTITIMTYDVYVAQGIGIIKIDTKITTGTLKALFVQLEALGQDLSAYQDLIDSLGADDITITSELVGYDIK